MEVNDIVLFDFDAFISGSKDVDYQEAIKKMSLSLMKFLIENDLLVNSRQKALTEKTIQKKYSAIMILHL